MASIMKTAGDSMPLAGKTMKLLQMKNGENKEGAKLQPPQQVRQAK